MREKKANPQPQAQVTRGHVLPGTVLQGAAQLAPFEDRRSSTVAQYALSRKADDSRRVGDLKGIAQRAVGGVVQGVMHKPEGKEPLGEKAKVWLGTTLEDKKPYANGHLFSIVTKKKKSRADTIGVIASKAASLGVDANAAAEKVGWVNDSTKYNDENMTAIAPYCVRIGGAFGTEEGMSLTYHYGPFNHGYVVAVQDHKETGSMLYEDEARTGKHYSNAHQHTGTDNILEDSATAGTTRKTWELSFDATTKLAGEGARFECVRRHRSYLQDKTKFFTVSEKRDGSVRWITFENLWLSWGFSFHKQFGIKDDKVKAELAKPGFGEDGRQNNLTASVDYNLDTEQKATLADTIGPVVGGVQAPTAGGQKKAS